MYYKLGGKIFLSYYTGIMPVIWLHICLTCLWRVVISSYTYYNTCNISVQQNLIKRSNVHCCLGYGTTFSVLTQAVLWLEFYYIRSALKSNDTLMHLEISTQSDVSWKQLAIWRKKSYFNYILVCVCMCSGQRTTTTRTWGLELGSLGMAAEPLLGKLSLWSDQI